MLLSEREGDPEEILTNLGFAGRQTQHHGLASRIPERFLKSPTKAEGINFQDFLDKHPELKEYYQEIQQHVLHAGQSNLFFNSPQELYEFLIAAEVPLRFIDTCPEFFEDALKECPFSLADENCEESDENDNKKISPVTEITIVASPIVHDNGPGVQPMEVGDGYHSDGPHSDRYSLSSDSTITPTFYNTVLAADETLV